MSLKHEVPEKTTFTKKILSIPSLKEMGITESVAGLLTVGYELNLSNHYEMIGTWVNRDDVLISYSFSAFNEKDERTLLQKILGHADMEVHHHKFNILSPIDGLIVGLRSEDSTTQTLNGLKYQNTSKNILPIILIPNNEPIAEEKNFDIYNKLASSVQHYFFRLSIINRLNNHITERLESWATGKGDDIYKKYEEYHDVLKNRNQEKFQSYNIREINKKDESIISTIQHFRKNDIDLKHKFVHISREFGESI